MDESHATSRGDGRGRGAEGGGSPEGDRSRRLQGQTVLAGGEVVLDGVETAGAEGHGAGARGVEPGVSVLPPQPHDPEHGLVALLRVEAALEDSSDEPAGCRADRFGPADEARRCPLGVGALGARHVLGHGGRLSVVAALVRRHAAALEEDRDGRRGVADLDLLAEELERHAVGVSFDDDVVVDVEAAQLRLREDVARGRQWLERRTVDLLVEGAEAS